MSTVARRGPLTLLQTNRKVRWWTGALLIGVPLLYVLSSGPMVTVLWRTQMSYLAPPGPNPVASPGPLTGAVAVELERGGLWEAIYSPLVWVAEHNGGELLWEYWLLFPVIRTGDTGSAPAQFVPAADTP